MDKNMPPFKVDLAGTFLKPKVLKEAHEQFRTGQLSFEALQAIADSEIRTLVQTLKSNGLKVVTDGNFRSNSWLVDFMSEFDGMQFKDAKRNQFTLKNRIDVHKHSVINDFVFLTGVTNGDIIAKQVLPAPSMVLARLLKDDPANVKAVYPVVDQLFEDMDRIYRRIMSALYDSGCRYIQFDDTTRVITDDAIRLNNMILADQPDDLFIAFHASADLLISLVGVDAFFLDYDDECCNRYKLLWFVKEEKATFGFIPSYYPVEEELDDFRMKIDEVRRYIPMKRFSLCIPNANVQSTEKYEVAEEKQWHTLDMAMRVAKELWPG